MKGAGTVAENINIKIYTEIEQKKQGHFIIYTKQE
jgi:hypothetical protein